MSFEDQIQLLMDDILKSNGENLLFSNRNEKFDEIVVYECFRSCLKSKGIAHLETLGDLAIQASELKLAPPELIFDLFSDAVDVSTIQECQNFIWKDLELKIPKLLQFTLNVSLQRPKLSLLKVANDILKRLSISSNSDFCGRILMLLSKALPLSDSSGFNIGGFFNTEHETKIEPFEASGISAQEYVQYERFWRSTQFFASNVQITLKHLQDFKLCMEQMLSLFESKPIVASANTTTEEIFFPKYLTAGKLLPLQVMDSTFRKNVLVQALFFLRQFILTSEATVPPKGELIQLANTYRVRVIKLLNQFGREFTDSILAQVDREIVWESWKKEKCPPIEQPVSEVVLQKSEESQRFEQAQHILATKPFAKPKWLENQQTQMLVDDEDEEEDEMRDDLDLDLFSERMADSFLPGYDCEDYDPKKDFVYCWQGMRLARQKNLNLIQQVGLKGTFAKVVKVMRNIPTIDGNDDDEEEVALSVTPVATTNTPTLSETAAAGADVDSTASTAPSQPASAIGNSDDDDISAGAATHKRQKMDTIEEEVEIGKEDEGTVQQVDIDVEVSPSKRMKLDSNTDSESKVEENQ
jgi:hypothetical protein